MTAAVTVELMWVEKTVERWIRFGRIVEDDILDRRRRRVGFAAGSVFAFVRWAANDYGTEVSRLDVLRAVAPDEPYSTVPGVTPGAEMLLRAFGWVQVERALRAIDAVETTGVDPCDVAPDYWRHVHNRLVARETPRLYSLERHRAWLKRRKLGS